MKLIHLLESSRVGEKLFHSTMLWTLYNILQTGVLRGTQYSMSSTGKEGECAENEICTVRQSTFNKVASTNDIFGRISGSTGVAIFEIDVSKIIGKVRGAKIKPIGELPRDNSIRLEKELGKFTSDPGTLIKRLTKEIVASLSNLNLMKDHPAFTDHIDKILKKRLIFKGKQTLSISADLATLISFQSVKREGEERIVLGRSNKLGGIPVKDTKIIFLPIKNAVESEIEDWVFDYKQDSEKNKSPKEKIGIVMKMLKDPANTMFVRDSNFNKLMKILEEKEKNI